MTRFPSAGHLASWAGVCPGNDQSAGRRRSGHTTKGSKWLKAVLIEVALAATRTKDTYLAALYRKIKARRGHLRALIAVAHSILVSIWNMLTTGETYRELGGDYFLRKNPDRHVRRLIRQLEALGHQVNLMEVAV